jgi:hypothetical protein
MKLSVILAAAVLCSAANTRADVEVTMAELQGIGFLPQDKADLKPEDKLDMKRRNPFAEKKKVVATRPTESVETEESKLRAFFDKQKVSGLMKLSEKYIVSLGRLTLEAGQTVPPIIPGQTQILRVMRVDDKVVEIGWVEDHGYNTALPRKILKRIDLKPVVGQLLASEDNAGENAQMFYTDGDGKAVLPPQGIFPNPSAIVESIPPGSDTNPSMALDSMLTADEQAQLGTVNGANAAPETPSGNAPAVVTPESAPSPDSGEDIVQPDPALVAPPPAEGVTPAGPPQNK